MTKKFLLNNLKVTYSVAKHDLIGEEVVLCAISCFFKLFLKEVLLVDCVICDGKSSNIFFPLFVTVRCPALVIETGSEKKQPFDACLILKL